MGLQHALAMVGGIVTPPLLVGYLQKDAGIANCKSYPTVPQCIGCICFAAMRGSKATARLCRETYDEMSKEISEDKQETKLRVFCRSGGLLAYSQRSVYRDSCKHVLRPCAWLAYAQLADAELECVLQERSLLDHA